MADITRIKNLITVTLLAMVLTAGSFVAVMADDADVADASADANVTEAIAEDTEDATVEEDADAVYEEIADDTAEDEDEDAGEDTAETPDQDAGDEADTTVHAGSEAVDAQTPAGSDADEDADSEEVSETVTVPTVTLTDFGNEFSYVADASGVVKIADFLNKFDEGAFGTESFIMVVNGVEYPLTVYSDGTYDGKLPKGFSIKNGVLRLAGVTGDMDIQILDHTLMSSMSREPDFEEPFFEEPSFTAPAGGTASTRSGNYASHAASFVTYAAAPEAVEEPAEETVTEEVAPSVADTDETEVLGDFSEPEERSPFAAVALLIAALALTAAAVESFLFTTKA